MPLTPLHTGASIFLGSLTHRKTNIIALILGSFMLDFEPLLIIIFKGCYYCSHHSFFHSIPGAFFGSFIIAYVLYILKKPAEKLLLKFNLKQSFSSRTLYLSVFLGWLTHVFFDSLINTDVYPFFPLSYNPFLIGKSVYWPINIILGVMLISGLIIFFIKIKKEKTNA